MASSEDALLAWLAGDTRSFVREQRKVKKLYRDRPDTSSNSDENSADYIPMEKVSRAYIERKEKADSKDLNKKIDASLQENSGEGNKVAPVTQAESAMDEPVREYYKEIDKIDRAKRRQAIQDDQLGRQRDEYGKIVRPKKTVAEKQAEAYKEPITDSEVEQAAQKQSQVKSAVPSRTPAQQPVLRLEDTPTIAPTETPTITPPETQQAKTELESLDLAGSPSTELSKPPDVVLPMQTADVPTAGKSGPLSEIYVDPASAKDEGKQQDFSDLSTAFTDATSRDISVLGMQVPKGGAAYDIAEKALGGIQAANAGLVGAPIGLRRIGAYLFKPYDAIAGTNLFEKHNQTTDQMEKFVDSFGMTKEPTNVVERAMYALGASTLPIPGASVAKTTAGSLRQLGMEAILPGTFVRPGASLAATYAASVPATAVVNEGLHQTLSAIDNLRKSNPPVPNSKGDVEPRVLSVDAPTAKEIQKKADASIASFIPNLAEASYGDGLLVAAGGAAALYGIARGIRHFGPRPVEGRTIVDPANPTPEPRPVSATTAGEAVRTLEQDATHVIESQARRAGADDVAMDISTQTRAGLDARIEAAQNTGALETPGYQYQLTTSPKALAEFHLSRPTTEQADLSWALHTMDQVDHAQISKKGNMPAQGDVQRAQAILAKPENQTTVQALAEMRIAQAEIMEKSGIWDAQTKAKMLKDRPNYVHNIGTGDYVIENGVSRPMTRFEQARNGLLKKTDEVAEGVDLPEDLNPASARTRLFKPTQALDAVLANQIALQQTVRFAYENDIRKRFVQAIETDPELKKSITPLKNNQTQPSGTGIVRYFDGGEEKRIATEPMLAKSLQFAPYTTIRWLATGKNMLQYTTTGPLAPWFGFTSTILEMGLGSVTRARSTRLGYIDQALQAVSGGRVSYPGDLLGTAAAVAVNAVKAVRTSQILDQTQKLEQALLSNPSMDMQQVNAAFGGNFVRSLSRGLAVGNNVVVQDLIDNGRRLYENTPKGIGLKSGALHSSRGEMLRNISEFDSQNTRDAFLRELGQGQGTLLYRWWNNYIHAMGDFHDLTKLAYIDQNRNASRRELAYETRKLSGDLGKRGLGNRGSNYELSPDTSLGAGLAMSGQSKLGGLTDFMRDGTRYYNPHIQGTTRFMEALAQRPQQTLAGVVNAVTLPTLASLATASMLGPEYVDYLLNKREEYKKTNYIYVPVPGRKPEDGMNLRIDPVMTVFGYPILEAIDSVAGIRKGLNDKAPNAETQGIRSAMSEALKEYVGLGAPWPIELGLAYNGIAQRNVVDQSFTQRSEQLSGLGEGKNPASALSVPMQMVLEQMIGAAAQTGIHMMDAYVSTDAGTSHMAKIGNAFRQGAYDTAARFPIAGSFFGGNRYNESATALADNSRKMLSAVRKIDKVGKLQERALLHTKTPNPNEASMEVPNVQQGYPGFVQLPQDYQKAVAATVQLLKRNGEISGIISERRRISNNLTGLRAVNAGNIGRHIVVPFKEGAEVAGLNYMIVHAEKLKEEGAAELYSLQNPNLNKNGSESKRQRLKPVLETMGGHLPVDSNGKLKDPRTNKFFRAPTLNEVNEVRNALNRRRYALDLRAATAMENAQRELGIKFTDIASKIKLDPSDAEDDEE